MSSTAAARSAEGSSFSSLERRPGPPGWEAQGRDTWSAAADAGAVSSAYTVTTYAELDGVSVIVDVVDLAAETAVVRASNPEHSGMDHRPVPPPHPLLEAMAVSPYSVHWVGTVPWGALTVVCTLPR